MDCRETSNPGTFYIYWREPDGQRRKQSTYSSGVDAALAFFYSDAFQASRAIEVKHRQPACKGDPLWDELLDWYDSEKRREGVSPSTLVLTMKLRRATTGLRVSETDGTFWETYKTQRRDGMFSNVKNEREHWKETNCRCSDASLKRELTGVLAVLRLGAKAQRVDRSLIPEIRLPDATDVNRARWLTTAELKTLLNYALRASPPEGQGKLKRVALWTILALCTGGRARAIETLTWKQIDFEGGWINLHRPDRRKTKKVNAVVPLTDEMRPLLERAFRERENPWVLRLSTIIGVIQWKPFCLAALGRYVNKHALRHSLATKMANDGMSSGAIADWLGNTEAMVNRVYLHHEKAQRAKREFLANWKPL